MPTGGGRREMSGMALPYDLEDVVGTSLAFVLRRFAMLWGCLMTGTVMAGAALMMAALVEAAWGSVFGGGGLDSMEFPGAVELMLGLCFGFFAGLASSLGVFYGAFLLGLTAYYFRAEIPHPYVWAGGGAVVALNVMTAAWGGLDWWWCAVALVFWLVLLLGLLFIAKWRLMAERMGAEIHFMGVAGENEIRRWEMSERTGGAVADREYALGDQPEQRDGRR